METKRFARTAMLLGEKGMQNLQNTTVMVVGLGAVGGYALEALARSGIGHFILVDFDVFEESNINRQILATTQTLGLKKIEAAKQRVQSINPQAEIRVFDTFVNAETLPSLLALQPDIVVDAIDALNPKCDLMQALYQANIPFVSSMGAALKTDTTKIRVGPLSDSKNCALAKFVRKRLKRRGVDLSRIQCVWSDEQNTLPDTALNMPTEEKEGVRTRHTMGSLPTITAIFGLTIANQIILKRAKI
jgi:tRNA A37 threonylcarbamoyladenosine dehydratase